MQIKLVRVDYNDEQQSKDLVNLLDAYAMDPMGGAEALDDEVKHKLPQALAKVTNAFSFICYVDGQPAGLINCFTAFSTFKCKPLINIHDWAVKKQFRGLGLSRKLLEAVEGVGRELGCCKITLEVLEGNQVAKNAYTKFGFEGYELDPEMGQAVFWQKSL